jgi:hypothetical protein
MQGFKHPAQGAVIDLRIHANQDPIRQHDLD